MRKYTLRIAYLGHLAMMLGLLMPLAACSSSSTAARANNDLISHPFQPGQNTITLITQQVLDNMHLHAYNPNAMTKGTTTGGLYINWKMSDPSVVNVTRPGSDGTTIHDHDPQVDLLYLNALVEYQQLHTDDHSYDNDLQRASSLVLTDFQRYSLPRGWIYFYLLRIGALLHNLQFVNEAQAVATNLYTVWFDPKVGTIYDRVHSPGDYDTNQTMQAGTALIDAGMRWHQTDWITAGEKTVDHTVSVAFDQQYHLFYDSMMIVDGHDQVESYKSRPSTDGESVEALVTAYKLTHRQSYLNVASSVLHSLFTSSGLWDQSYGGFYFTLELDTGTLVTNYKETRSQTLVLLGLHYYNQVSHSPLMAQEQQLVEVITKHFYQSAYHGYVYRLTPDFHIYVSKPGAGPGVEDYFTTEAMGTSLDALLQTQLNVSE